MELKDGEPVKERETDLLIGMVSYADSLKNHYLLADFDNITEEQLFEKIRRPLFMKRRFGDCYVVKSGKGFHLLNFSNKLSIDEYVRILKELNGDPLFLEWVQRVKYGVLRLSRRSSHGKVPELVAVIKGYRRKEDETRKLLYLQMLYSEKKINKVRRVKVLNNTIKTQTDNK